MGTRYRGTLAEARALNSFIKLVRAADSVSARVEAHLAGIGLTVSQFGVLEALYHLGPLFQKDLASKILKSTGNVTMVVDNLERRGLVARTRNEQDRRHFLVSITAEGKRLIRGFFPGHVGRIVRELSVLTASEQDELARLCRAVGLQRRSATGRHTAARTG